MFKYISSRFLFHPIPSTLEAPCRLNGPCVLLTVMRNKDLFSAPFFCTMKFIAVGSEKEKSQHYFPRVQSRFCSIYQSTWGSLHERYTTRRVKIACRQSTLSQHPKSEINELVLNYRNVSKCKAMMGVVKCFDQLLS